MEGREEFVIRMYRLTQELPKDSLSNLEDTLSLLCFQLKLREVEMAEETVDNFGNVETNPKLTYTVRKYSKNEDKLARKENKGT